MTEKDEKRLCRLCPRDCRADRDKKPGCCLMPRRVRIARAALHYWEEPPISGTRGSGTIFFCGCNLRCVYCQNSVISRDGRSVGREVDDELLAELMFRLRDEGAHNINLVTPTHYADALMRVLPTVRKTLGIPVVYNCGGYESVETLRALDGLVDIYLPDFKYASSYLAARYSGAPDYPEKARLALAEMYRQVGNVQLDADGIMQKGVIVRHLVLPGCRKDSAEVLAAISETVPVSGIYLSLLRQYTPDYAPREMKELCRKITTFEYDFVTREAEKYGFDGFLQEKESANRVFTPDFSEKTF